MTALEQLLNTQWSAHPTTRRLREALSDKERELTERAVAASECGDVSHETLRYLLLRAKSLREALEIIDSVGREQPNITK